MTHDQHSAGAQLRAARESRGLQLADIAGTLRIKPQFLDALESNRLEALPSPTHASGFLRSYARYLGVDLAHTDFVTPAPREMAPLATPAVTVYALAKFLPPLLVMGGLIVLYALWQWLQPPEPAPIAPPPANYGLQSAAPKLQPLEPPINPKVEQKSETVPLVATPALALPTAAAPLAAAPAKPVVALETAKLASVTVRAVSDAWVQITDASGRQLYSRLMRAGESWRVPSQPGLRLSTGNAGGLVLVRNGEAGAPLGAQAQVLRNVVLTDAAPTKPVAAEPAAPVDETADAPDVEN